MIKLSVTQRKNGKWYTKFTINGVTKHKLCAGATTKKQAEEIENAYKYKLQQQLNGVIPMEEKKVTVDKGCDKFLEHSELNKKSYKQDKSRIKVIREFFKKCKYINNIKLDDIEQFKRYLLNRGLKKITVNKYLEVLSKMFNIAIRNDWAKKNPIEHDVKFVIKEDNSFRQLSFEEQERLLEVVKGTYLEGVIIFALNTGLRLSDILPLKWKEIKSYNDKIIHLYVRKTNKYMDMPCTQMLYDYIERTPKENRKGNVFINPRTKRPPKTIRRAWKTAKEKAGIKNFRFHDLRHTVASRLVNAGVPLPTVKKVMTHSDISTTMRYVHTPDEEMFKAMEVLNSCNKGIIQNG